MPTPAFRFQSRLEPIDWLAEAKERREKALETEDEAEEKSEAARIAGTGFAERHAHLQCPAVAHILDLDLLAGNGRLVKRPIVTDGKRFTVGYAVDEFAAAWGGRS